MCFSVKIDQDVQKVANRLSAQISKKHFEEFQQMQSAQPKKFKLSGEDARIFPNIYAPVLTIEGGTRLLRPMRYRLRPSGSKEEVPTKYNMYNARLDSLESRGTWSSLFGKQHCLLPFQSFYEWVPKEGKKALINFIPKNTDLMWAPGLYDTWISKDGQEVIHSFAIITTDPPKEVQSMGHDRCPVFITQDLVEEWLTPEKMPIDELYGILKSKAPSTYSHQWA